MTWARVQAIVQRVLALPEAERDAALARECGSDLVMFARLRKLLAAGRAHEDLFEPVVPQAVDGASAPGLASGESIGAWRLEQRLGAGGMGDVWLVAREGADFRQRGALKVIKRGMDTDSVLTRFRRERRVLAELEHANIPRLLDGGATSDGRPYFVMEYVEGVAVDAYARERGLDLQARLQLFSRVCEALAHAHEHGVVHRDLKPSNVLVTADGEPKLLDFGIAKVLESDSAVEALDLTLTGQQMLTPRYASPEQLRGEPVTAATDVYALGLILWELLVGRPAVQLDGLTQADLRESICEHAIARPSVSVEPNATALRRALAGDLDTICAMALRKEPERRYASVKQLADDVRRHLDGLPVLARPDTMTYRVSKFVRRNRVLVGATLAVIVALTLGLVVAIAFYARSEQQRSLSESRLVDSQYFAYQSVVRGAYTALQSGNPVPDISETPKERRGWEWRHIRARSDCTRRVVWRAPGATSIALGGQGRFLAVSEGPVVVLVDLESDREHARISVGYPQRDLALSPDARYLAASFDRTIELYDTASGAPVWVLPCASRPDTLTFSPDGQELLSGHWDGSLRLTPVDCPMRSTRIARVQNMMRSMEFSRDGQLLVAGGGVNEVLVMRWSDKQVLERFKHPASPQYVRAVAVFSDARYVAGVSNNGRTCIWDRTTGEALPASPDNAQYCMGIGVRADRDELVIIGRHVRVWSLATGGSRVLPGMQLAIRGLEMHPTRPLAYTTCDDGRVHEWDVSTEQVPAFRGGEQSQAIAIRPGGAQFAVLEAVNRRVRVLDVASGRSTAIRNVDRLDLRAVVYTASGDRVVVSDGRGLVLLDAVDLGVRARIEVESSGTFAVRPGTSMAYVDAGGSSIVRVDLERGEICDAHATPFAPIDAIASDSTGQWVAVGGGQRASVAITRWGSGAWRALDQGLGDKLYVLAFSPDGRWLAAGSSQLRVYALDSLEVVFERPSKETKGVVFTREADRLLAASGSMLEVIDAQRWTVIATFVDNIRGINALAYCPITESLFAPDVSRDIRHFRAVAAPMFEAVR